MHFNSIVSFSLKTMAFFYCFLYNILKEGAQSVRRKGIAPMKISEIVELLNAEVLCGEELLDNEVHSACGSDMMSDVLAYVKDQAVLLTGLVNAQVIRTAQMMDMICVVFVRSKQPTADMVELAQEAGITLMSTKKRMYEACGLLYASGLGNGAGA